MILQESVLNQIANSKSNKACKIDLSMLIVKLKYLLDDITQDEKFQENFSISKIHPHWADCAVRCHSHWADSLVEALTAPPPK